MGVLISVKGNNYCKKFNYKMKKTKYIILFCFIILFSNKSRGQFAIAGTPGAVFIDILPDTLLNPSGAPGAGVHSMYYYIDINQDTINDIEINANATTSPGAYYWYVNISSLNSFTDFSLGSIDSTFSNSSQCSWWITRPILNIFHKGDTIYNGNYVSSGYLGYRNAVTGCNYDVKSSQWLNQGDVFFGVQYKTAFDTSFGWVKVNVTNYQNVLIKEFSLGGTSVGLNSNVHNADFISIYPNPTRDKIYVLSNKTDCEHSKYKILNMTGNVVKQGVFLGSISLIDLSSLYNGIYILSINTTDGILTKKLVIQR